MRTFFFPPSPSFPFVALTVSALGFLCFSVAQLVPLSTAAKTSKVPLGGTGLLSKRSRFILDTFFSFQHGRLASLFVLLDHQFFVLWMERLLLWFAPTIRVLEPRRIASAQVRLPCAFRALILVMYIFYVCVCVWGLVCVFYPGTTGDVLHVETNKGGKVSRMGLEDFHGKLVYFLASLVRSLLSILLIVFPSYVFHLLRTKLSAGD